MKDKPVALVTGANKDTGLPIARVLAASGLAVLVGSSNPDRGEQAAREPVRLALMVEDGPIGTSSNEDGPLPWQPVMTGAAHE